ncbi:MAG: hypothetical protein JXA10_00940 [Anaerolineae bacterium]|nr:hypothetical protein [Anaerolineae bacterium]
MATNASTWFYTEPEHDRFLLEERVNHTFWGNRIMAITLYCTNAKSPFQMEGEWRGVPVTIEWVPRESFTLTMQAACDDSDKLILGIKEILALLPTVSYVNAAGELIAEWYVTGGEDRARQIESNSSYKEIKRYKK